MSAAATCVCAAIALTFHSGSPHGHSAPRTVSRTATSAIAMQDLLDKPSSTAKRYAWQKSSSSEVEWITSPSGYKFIEEKIGQGPLPTRGDVVQIHYTVSLLSSGACLLVAAKPVCCPARPPCSPALLGRREPHTHTLTTLHAAQARRSAPRVAPSGRSPWRSASTTFQFGTRRCRACASVASGA